MDGTTKYFTLLIGIVITRAFALTGITSSDSSKDLHPVDFPWGNELIREL